mgnify:CR=1 FL=1
MKTLEKPVSRMVEFGRGQVAITLTSAGDVPVITFRHKGSRTTFTLPLAAAYAQAVGRTVAQQKDQSR